MNIGYINPSTINDNIMTEKLRNRFCKDVGVNIKFCGDRDLFMDRLTICSEDIQNKYIEFVEEVTELGGEQAFFEHYNKVKEDAINAIKKSSYYDSFINGNINERFSLPKLNYPNNGIFKETNIGKKLLSIDLKKGNYTAMRYFNKDLVANTNSYEDFISKFTSSKHIINSKYIRQVIFGNCNPKRQTHIERWLMVQLFDDVKYITDNVVAFMDDEIVFDVSHLDDEGIKEIRDSVFECSDNLDIEIHFKVFVLEKLNEVYFLKDTNGNIIDTKCVNYITFPFVQRLLRNEEPIESDYIFEFEGMRAKLLENPLSR